MLRLKELSAFDHVHQFWGGAAAALRSSAPTRPGQDHSN
jgi:hypothetical protein